MIPVTRVEVELTEKCNLRCKFCYNSCNPVACSKPFSILDALAASGAMEVILTGGEPSLHPDFFNILEYSQSIFPRVMVQSNGTPFSEEDAFNLMAGLRPFCVNFSLHGPESIHDSLTTVNGSFRKTTKSLSMAVKAGIRTATNFVLTSANSAPDLLRETVGIITSLGVEEMTLTRFIPCGLGKDAILLSTSADVFVTALRTLVKETKEHRISLLLGNATPACRLPEDLHGLCNRCSFGLDKFYVDVHGNVLTCGMTRIVIGNLLKSSMREVLAASPVRQTYIEGRHLPEKCRQCINLAMCGGGCRAAALAGGGSLCSEEELMFTSINSWRKS
jgi:radical SAM protein with 4Fe4S-binding SPASM domain